MPPTSTPAHPHTRHSSHTTESASGASAAGRGSSRPYAHGTYGTYRKGCRCGACRNANAAQGRKRRRLIAYGRWEPLTDAGPVREHVRALQQRGLSIGQIAELAGVGDRTVSMLLYGNGDLAPSRRVRPATAEAVLAVRPTDLPSYGWVCPVGARRRLQALIAIGWTSTHLAGRLHTTGTQIWRITSGAAPHITPATAQAVRNLYDQLWNTPGPSTKARNRAARHGWLPPLAWDDDTIDDPTARPATARDRSTRRSDDLWQSSEELRAQGLDDALIAERLDVTLATLRRARERAKARRRTTRTDREQGVA